MNRAFFALSGAAAWLGLLWFDASPAQACPCLDGAELSWPRPSATDVPREPSLVLGERRALVTLHSLWLVDPSGNTIQVEPTGNPDLSAHDGCGYTYRFFKPAVTLEPNTTYTVWLQPNGGPVGDRVPIAESTFTTGEALAEPPPEQPSVSYRVLFFDAEECDPERIYLCGAFAQVSLSGAAVTSGASTWLRVQEANHVVESVELESVLFDLGNPGYDPAVEVLLPLTEDEHCIAYEWIGTRGETLAEGTACEPVQCARVPEVPPSPFPLSTCHPYEYRLHDGWGEPTHDSCINPPPLPGYTSSPGDAGLQGEDVSPDAGVPQEVEPSSDRDAEPSATSDTSQGNKDGGLCSLRPTGGGSWSTSLAGLALIALALLVRVRSRALLARRVTFR